ncbi:calpain-A-like isoform X5 [Thrips palmi]|uniref:Calpain-A-like isoform X5 n=1 Tax=Thrips palmi TaxID=161013 RepID=A0A6P9A4T6_THRPL|nr:calpain-A-like isoform X5 [Thrips palmi]
MGEVEEEIVVQKIATDVQDYRPLWSSFGFKDVGEKGSGIRARGEVQDFHKIQAQCLSEGVLWEDPNFPAVDSSIFYTRGPPKPFEWRRPGEITGDPQFMVDGASRFDIQQGELGDCWLLAAVANLTLHDDLFFQVVPDDQGFEGNYCGVFHFRFWQYGRWLDVVIDDRLPTVYGELVFLHSATKNEFWSALLEKAYAKLHGSYEALKGGTTCEGMEDFTGGVTEMYELKEAPSNLYKVLLKAYERSSLMACSIEPDPYVTEARTDSGLVKGHAYSITRVQYVDVQTPRRSGKIPLIRLRNPWGNEAEWNGPWSDQSPEWRLIPDHSREEIGLTFDDDGEFWMSYEDFLKHFTQLEMCNLSPDSMEDDNIKKWEANTFEGEWVRGVTAGGCRNYLDTFWHNPQYRITLTDVDEDDDENRCTVIVALMQKNRRAQRKKGMECLTIGFAVYNLGHDPDSLPKPLDYNFFKYNASCARSPSFINLREVSCRFKLPPGSYCIVPSTFEPNDQGEFLLRVYSEKRNNMEEHDEEVGIGHLDPRVKDEDEDTELAKKDEKVKALFLKLAGEDGEVDWMELKEIMDYTMRNELPSRPRPPTHQQIAPAEDDTLVGQLVNLLCGVICKDTPFGAAFASGGEGHAADTRSSGFAKEVCRSMVAMMDADHSGKLGYEEFKILWTDIRHWRKVFKLYSKEGQGFLSAFELRQALNSAGYRLNNHILNILFHRYGAADGTITFDDFMMCAIRMKTMIDLFRERDPDNTNTVSFSLEEWMEKTLYS